MQRLYYIYIYIYIYIRIYIYIYIYMDPQKQSVIERFSLLEGVCCKRFYLM